MQTYRMRRFTIVAPSVRNDGTMSDYPAKLRAALLAAGIDGWTETETHGSWRGVREAGVTFEILVPIADTRQSPDTRADVVTFVGARCTTRIAASVLAGLARAAMGPEQEAIQVTIEHGVADVFEA